MAPKQPKPVKAVSPFAVYCKDCKTVFDGYCPVVCPKCNGRTESAPDHLRETAKVKVTPPKTDEG